MGLFDFVKDMGEKLDAQMDLAAKINESGIEVQDMKADFSDGVASVSGVVNSLADKEKIVVMLGNVEGVEQVNESLNIAVGKKESKFYTVKGGDTLGKIAKEFYGNAMKYMVIFEANKPMLKDPNKIYPGQVLRIPELD
ncbi:MAG: peptidoglycan-binding protein LysM [Acidobacteriota bacterium]